MEEIENGHEEVSKTVIDETPEENIKSDNDTDKKDSKLSQSVKHLKKASAEVINKICAKYEHKRMEKAYKFLTDMLTLKCSRLIEA